ncbi:thermostable hemolysin [Celerinatantimonas yamalensis]|uniref:Thermostable hemolysin n=1 Tax=Celerinatantimonas yamalensis TaxID=559956 RepID=A0ABW9G4R0_9GAMM
MPLCSQVRPCSPPLVIVGPESLMRKDIEVFISMRYRSAFGATIRDFHPYFIVSFDRHQNIQFACGFRGAHLPLHLEQYLETPAEVMLGELLQASVCRDQLVEIGQLATFSIAQAPHLFLAVAELLLARGFKWAMVTATGPLWALFKRCGMHPLTLSGASLESLPTDEATLWGNYYHHRPRVLGADLSLMATQLRQTLQPELGVIGDVIDGQN